MEELRSPSTQPVGRPAGTPTTALAHPHLVFVSVDGARPSQARIDGLELPHLRRLQEAGHLYTRLPDRASLHRLRRHGYDVAVIDSATGELPGPHPDEALQLSDEAVRFIAGRRSPRPFALSLVLPCETAGEQGLRNLDRAVGQIVTALADWGLDDRTRVLLGPASSVA